MYFHLSLFDEEWEDFVSILHLGMGPAWASYFFTFAKAEMFVPIGQNRQKPAEMWQVSS